MCDLEWMIAFREGSRFLTLPHDVLDFPARGVLLSPVF
jgi:hypothetical protein